MNPFDSKFFRRKHSFSCIIALITISIIGIVTVQYMWISKSYAMQREQFRRTTRSAIIATVMSIERKVFAVSLFGTDDVSAENSVRAMLPHVPFEDEPHRPRHDRPERERRRLSEYEAHGPQYEYYEPNEMPKMLAQMMREIQLEDTPIHELIDLKTVSKIIEEEFSARDLNVRPEFAICDGNDCIPELQSKGYDTDMTDSGKEIVIHLFRAKIFNTRYDALELHVQKFESPVYVLWSLWGELLVSFLFVMTIMISFYVTLRAVIYQKKVSQIKTDFINNMTHEFKTPIATISLAADSIASPLVVNKPDAVKSYIRIIKEENSRMNNHVERVLQMSVIDKTNFSVSLGPADVNEVVQKAVQSMSLFISEYGGSVTVKTNAKHSMAELDEIHFINVVMNIIENAIKYSKSAPQVTVSTQNDADNSHLILKVSDQGIGMTEEQMAHAFDRFYRAEGGNVHNVKGFGLGLCYVKAVVEAHGGTIDIESKKGVGTTFTVKIEVEEK